ncbi:uncharacterized protein LOC120162846 [Hibiscus syriacus]|uniref:uncharacterized protein LOC120162846 n=1 Tax=Hibiscus syriacus TaxID=106335 RepID=UPI001922F287|nr:uncharacterized protein LOC120162846 [Hibiscus syriacus]
MYLFRLYNEVELDWIISEGPCYFNSHLLVFHRLAEREDPMLAPLNNLDLWVLINGLPVGFILERVTRQLGNFVGTFIEYDVDAVFLRYSGNIRVRVSIDVRKALKRKKKLAKPSGSNTNAMFQYEKLKLSCFLYEKLGHGESFCPLRVLQEKKILIT